MRHLKSSRILVDTMASTYWMTTRGPAPSSRGRSSSSRPTSRNGSYRLPIFREAVQEIHQHCVSFKRTPLCYTAPPAERFCLRPPLVLPERHANAEADEMLRP